MSQPIQRQSYDTWRKFYKAKHSYYGKNATSGTFSEVLFRQPAYYTSHFCKHYTNQKSGRKLRYKDIFALYNKQYVTSMNSSSSSSTHHTYHSSGYVGWYHYSYYDHYYDDRRYRDQQMRKSRTYNRNKRNIRSSASRSRGRGSAGGGK